MNDSKLSMYRRGFLRAGLTSAAALPIVAGVFASRTAQAQSVTESEANKIMVQSLQYVEISAKEGQDCAGCQLYTAGEAGRGKCQLFMEGTVAEKGWCMSWAQKI